MSIRTGVEYSESRGDGRTLYVNGIPVSSRQVQFDGFLPELRSLTEPASTVHRW